MHKLLDAHHKFRQSDDDRVLPLVNVVFLLLIFFMIAGTMTVQDPFNVAPPESRSEGAGDLRESVLFVSADGEIAFDGDVLSEDELGVQLADRMKADVAIDLRLKADGSADAQDVVRIMAIASFPRGN